MLGKASPHVAAGQAVYETGALLLDKERREQREREYSDLANKGAASRVFEGAMNPVAVTYGAAANIRETSQVRARAKESGKAADMKREELESRYSNLAQNASTPAERDKYARALARLKKQAR